MTDNGQILVIEDDDDIREVMQEALASEGFHVDVARDGKDGLDVLDKLDGGGGKPLILLDMMMPKMDGEAFLKALRGRPALADAPVVVISGNASVREKASSLHAAACLVKPFELDELLGIVRRLTQPHPAAP
jgi:DNA-binding response OmpR family regulator